HPIFSFILTLMTPFHKHSRVPLLSFLRKAFFLSDQASSTGFAAEELLENAAIKSVHRRQFIGDVAKAGVALSAAGLLNGCRKAADLFEEQPPTLFNQTNYRSTQPNILILGAGMAGLNCA